MARQISLFDRPILGFEEWFLSWWREARQWPWVVQVSLEEPILAGRWLTLSIEPDRAVWMAQKGGKNRRRRLGYKLPVRFIHGRMTPETAQYLRGVTDALRASLGLNAREGLGLLLFLFIVGFDYHRMLISSDVSMLSPSPYRIGHGSGGTVVRNSLDFISMIWDASRTTLLRDGHLKGQNSMAEASFLRIPPANLGMDRPTQGVPRDAIGGAIYDIASNSHAALFGRAPAPAMDGEDLMRFLDGTPNRWAPKDDPTQPPEEDLEARNMFIHETTQWRIAYEGERQDLLSDLAGFRIIHYLLGRPDKGVSAGELCRLLDGEVPVVDNSRFGGDLEDDESMTVLNGWNDLGDRSDEDALRAYRRELKRLQELGREAVRTGLHDRFQEIADQITAIRERLHSDSDRAGRPRKEAPEAHQMRTRIHGLLMRAYLKIRKHCPALENHLRAHIRHQRGVYTYGPGKSMVWRL